MVMKSIIEVLSEGRKLPSTYDTWGWKVVRPDLTTRAGFVWPGRGEKLTAPNPIHASHVCPRYPGDGFCLLKSASAMNSVNYGSSTVILIAYKQKDILAFNDEKIRVRHVMVVDIIDFHRLIRTGEFSGADLRWATLSYADLRRADLYHADLSGVDLSGADLVRANLSGAILTKANLTDADGEGANLSGADLTGAILRRACLKGANLSGADLTDADLCKATLPSGYVL